MKPKKLNNSIEAPESDYLFIQTSQLISSGNGLYTAINIYKDEIISHFQGEVLSQMEAKRRVKSGEDKYFIMRTNGSILDSMKVNCFAKYANDAAAFKNSAFKNNAKISLDENSNICLTALRNIKSGEEIFCSYGKKYWQRHG